MLLTVAALLDPSRSLVPPARLRGQLLGPDGPCALLELPIVLEPGGQRRILTDCEGRFELAIDGLAVTGVHVLIAGQGVGPSRLIWDDPRPGEQIDLGSLGPPASCVGRVVNAYGDALGGDWWVKSEARAGSIARGVRLMDHHSTELSAQSGEFRLEGMLQPRAYLLAGWGGSVRAQTDGLLEPGFEVFREIRCDDEGLGAVLVRLVHPWGALDLGPVSVCLVDGYGRETRRPRRGTWGADLAFGGLPQGLYTLRLDDTRFERREVRTPHGSTIDVELVSRTHVVLDVRDRAGRVATDWSARVRLLETGVDLAMDAGGLRLPPTRVQVLVESEGWLPVGVELEVPAAAGEHRVPVLLDPGRALELVTRWPDGAPLRGARATVTSGEGLARRALVVSTDERGHAQLRGIGAKGGTLEVELGAGARISRPLPPGELRAIELTPDGGWIDLQLGLPPDVEAGAELYVEFAPPDDRRVPGAIVPVGQDLTARLGPLSQGEWTLYLALLHEDEELFAEVRVEVEEGRGTRCAAELQFDG